ncbi:GDP-mannose 4,6-dehydratase [Glycomyces artemisiae]|uniref:dTDP-glucose 4,6-dehydratase n=1 Tax=Glycomyces artemisiae TaxID=1076443 RepID=A0A2T0UUS5_9ACTN|nr:GDP-mannose 4,6-dehydratase [Glycomyces artemisiae]PRY61681.1 dTDP-glucose 4,6-dehydratase [Glycomyces artemisiae]
MIEALASGTFTHEEIAALKRDFADAYRDAPVLITGADGFLGSHLTDALVELGADVHITVRPKAHRQLHHLEHQRGRLTLHWCDLTDRLAVDQAVRALTNAERPVYVFNFAAFSHVGYSWHLPQAVFNANVSATLNLLQSLVDHRIELACFDQVGTSEEYGNAHGLHHGDDLDEVVFTETSPLDPQSIYGTSKVAQDFLARNFHAAYGLPVIVVRMFNHFGPRQSLEFITGEIIRQASQSERIVLGDLRPRRDFTFFVDGIRAHLALAAHGKAGEVYTYGNGRSITMKDWAQLIIDLGEQAGHWSARTLLSDTDRFRPGDSEVLALRVDATKVRDAVGWEPTVTWEAGLRRTIDYVNNARIPH